MKSKEFALLAAVEFSRIAILWAKCFPFFMHVKSVGPVRLTTVYPSQHLKPCLEHGLVTWPSTKFSLLCRFSSIISVRIDFDDLIFKTNQIIMQKASAKFKFNTARNGNFSEIICGSFLRLVLRWNVNLILLRFRFIAWHNQKRFVREKVICVESKLNESLLQRNASQIENERQRMNGLRWCAWNARHIQFNAQSFMVLFD